MSRGSGFREGTYDGWQDVFVGTNEWIQVVVTPLLGGRIIHFGAEDGNLLWVNDALKGQLPKPLPDDAGFADWQNFGGDKSWPAPQGWERDDEWHGPPDPVLDAGRYKADVDASGALTMESPFDPRTGLVIQRRVHLANERPGISVTSTYTNRSDRRRQWAPWHITQLACPPAEACIGGPYRLYIPLNENSRFEGGFHVMFGEPNNPQWRHVDAGLLEVNYEERVGKIGVDAVRGWLAYHREADDIVFCQTFEPYIDALDRYPDGGSTIECWTSGKGIAAGFDWGKLGHRYTEAEVLGPVASLAPGEQTSLCVDWNIAQCPAPIVSVESWGCVHRRFEVRQRSEDACLVAAVFGTFASGTVCVESSSRMSGFADPAGVQRLWSANVVPISTVRLAETVTLPPNHDMLRLRFEDQVIDVVEVK